MISEAKSQSMLRVASSCICRPERMLSRRSTLTERQRSRRVRSSISVRTSTTKLSVADVSPASILGIMVLLTYLCFGDRLGQPELPGQIAAVSAWRMGARSVSVGCILLWGRCRLGAGFRPKAEREMGQCERYVIEEEGVSERETHVCLTTAEVGWVWQRQVAAQESQIEP